MKFEDMIDDLKLEKLNSSHDVSKFSSNYEKADEFLKEKALSLQNTRKPMTMLMMHNGEIIGFYTTWVPDYELEDEIYEEMIKEGATREHAEKLVPNEIRCFIIDKKYDAKDFTLPLFGRIYGTTKLMMRAMTTDEPIAVLIGKYCKIPAPEEEIIEEIEKVNKKLKHPFYMNMKGILAE